MSQFLGTAKVKVNGQYVKTVPDTVVLVFGGKTVTGQMADDTFNSSQKPAASNLKFSLLLTAKTPLKMLNELQDGQVEIETDIGPTYLMTSATRMGDPISVSSAEGQVTVEFGGDPIPLK